MFSLCISLILIIPITSHELLKYTIEEKSPINTFVADIAKDLNMKTNGFYQIAELLPRNKNLFSIDNQTGYLTVQSTLDREDMCEKQQCACHSCEILLQLSIAIENKIFYKILEIKIKDLNDHSPKFDKQSMIHIIHIKENVPLGHRIVLPSANDPDEGLNSVQSYRLDGPNADDFDIDFSSFDIPYLIVRSSLDRQRRSSYSLTLIASDQGKQIRSDSIQLDIQICNTNESIPTFLQSVYSIDIREDTLIGTTILKIEAISDTNEKIFYELLTDSPFLIDRLTGQIQLRQTLDYEREKSYRLTVKALTNSIPTYASISIRIIDINDNPVSMKIKVEGNTTLKQHEHEKYVLFIEENIPIGTIIGHVILNDIDSIANGNPYLQLRTNEPPLPLIYKLIYQNSFQNTKLYSLIINHNLDRETKPIYNNIQLFAHDSGTPTLHTQLYLILNLTDINDCKPEFLNNSTSYHINENNPIGYIIDRLRANDCDQGENARVKYRILNQTDLLLINSQTGELVLNQSIDFESLNKFQQKNLTSIDLIFRIEIYDQGQPLLSNQQNFLLRIHDLNDHSPSFDQNQTYTWTYSQEFLQPGSVLGRINAYDQDSGFQGLVHYEIRSDESCLTLEITSLGYVYIPYKSSSTSVCSSGTYTFEIVASDYDPQRSRSSTQLLTIHIQSNETNRQQLPKLISLSTQRTLVDINQQNQTVFILDITNFNNQTYEPKLFLNNTNIYSCWNINPTGEVRLISHPFASSYILSLNIYDDYTNEKYVSKFQIDICNSSILNSCEQIQTLAENRTMLLYAIGLALLITLICIIIFSIIICLCCRKSQQTKTSNHSSKHQHSFLQCTDDFNNPQHQRYQSSSNSTIRDDDRDSACIINGHSSSSTSSSSGIVTKTENWFSQNESQMPIYPMRSAAYYYDLKLAEIIRNNQQPLCIHLNDQPSIPQSASTDYGFDSLELSESSSTSTLPNQSSIDQIQQKQFHMKSFISSRECVV